MVKIYWLLIGVVCVGCGSSGSARSTEPGDSGTTQTVSTPEDFVAADSDFDCQRNAEWTAVGLSHYKNVRGHGEEMLAVARSASGGVYPVGTIVQLNPVEAMVKRASGFAADSSDWEFFTLNTTATGSTIVTRGGGASVSNARATCVSCHLPAQSMFDLICGDATDTSATTAHGCTPLPVSPEVLAARPDPRCP
jgi:hypothetical protein